MLSNIYLGISLLTFYAQSPKLMSSVKTKGSHDMMRNLLLLLGKVVHFFLQTKFFCIYFQIILINLRGIFCSGFFLRKKELERARKSCTHTVNISYTNTRKNFLGGSVVKNTPANGVAVSIPG